VSFGVLTGVTKQHLMMVAAQNLSTISEQASGSEVRGACGDPVHFCNAPKVNSSDSYRLWIAG
jgi:hypothetical protein